MSRQNRYPALWNALPEKVRTWLRLVQGTQMKWKLAAGLCLHNKPKNRFLDTRAKVPDHWSIQSTNITLQLRPSFHVSP